MDRKKKRLIHNAMIYASCVIAILTTMFTLFTLNTCKHSWWICEIAITYLLFIVIVNTAPRKGEERTNESDFEKYFL